MKARTLSTWASDTHAVSKWITRTCNPAGRRLAGADSAGDSECEGPRTKVFLDDVCSVAGRGVANLEHVAVERAELGELRPELLHNSRIGVLTVPFSQPLDADRQRRSQDRVVDGVAGGLERRAQGLKEPTGTHDAIEDCEVAGRCVP